jgi:rubredoxin
MSNQVQCPNCGGYKTDVEKVESIGAYTKDTPARNLLAAILGLFIGLPIMLVLVCAAIAFFIMIITIPLGIVLWRVAQLLPEYITNAIKGYKEHAKQYWYKCEICGYSWVWREGQPLPKVNVRPEFLAKMEAQRWKCVACGNENEGSESSCRYCHYPKI